MDAKETQKKGIEYCRRYKAQFTNEAKSCSPWCPLKHRACCINNLGEFQSHYTDGSFLSFAEDFNFMIEELYNRPIPLEAGKTYRLYNIATGEEFDVIEIYEAEGLYVRGFSQIHYDVVIYDLGDLHLRSEELYKDGNDNSLK